MTDGGKFGHIIDFEFAAYQHALIDGAWMHVPGPAWMVVRDPAAALLEVTYRGELCRTVPQAGDDDIFDTGMAMARVMTAIERIGNFAKRRTAGW